MMVPVKDASDYSKHFIHKLSFEVLSGIYYKYNLILKSLCLQLEVKNTIFKIISTSIICPNFVNLITPLGLG